MIPRTLPRVLAMAVLGTVLASPAVRGLLEDCNAGARPAATLLIPYFEVAVDDLGGPTTLFAVGNAFGASALARVVLWTDWGVPTLAFDLSLAGDDLVTVNLRDVFAGQLPETGGDGVPGCTDPLTNPPLGPLQIEELRRQHTGQPDGSGLCAGSGRRGPDVATGYVTVDVLNACAETPRYPSEAGYFESGGDGLASNANVLYGDFLYVDPSEDFAQGHEAVHSVADSARFHAGNATFYSPFMDVPGLDGRAPLGTRYRARYMNGGAFDGGTDLVLWAAPSLAVLEPTPCGRRPEFVDLCQDLIFTPADEDGQEEEPVVLPSITEVAMKLPVGGAELPVDAPFGFVDVRSRTISACLFIPIGEQPLQSYVLPLHEASGRFSVGLNAVRTGDELCAPVPALPP